MRILMAADGSKKGTESLRAVSRMLGPENRRLDLVCVVPKVPNHAHHSHRERLYRRAQHIADVTKAMLAAEGITADATIRTGSPAGVLIGASHDYEATVLAAASRGDRAGLGPVASRVAEHGYGAVLLAREAQSESGIRLLVALDGSESSFNALRRVAELIDLQEAEVTLLHVVETPWLHAGADQEWLGYEEDEAVQTDEQLPLQKVFVQEAERILQAAREQLPRQVSINAIVREGIPADEILSESENGGYDLVVLGVTGSADMKHKILGSVSSKVAWNAPCSVLLIGSAEGSQP